MRIVLSGYYGFDNAGDEALLSAITSSIKKMEPQAEFVVFSGSPAKTSALHAIKAVYYMSPIKVIRELKQCDLLISGGGSIFQDITSMRSLLYYISIVALAKLMGARVMFYAQGVGPINRAFSKLMMRLVANRVDLITLRDEDSGQVLRNLGVSRPPFRITADPVFSLQPDEQERRSIKKIFPENQVSALQIGVSVRKWAALQGYQQELAVVLDHFSERGYQIIFIPMAYPDDVEESKKVMALMKQKAVIVEQELNSKEHLALIEQMDLVIGMRLHSLIFAANMGVPFAGISYDPKVEAFLKSFTLKPLGLQHEEMEMQLNLLLQDSKMRAVINSRAAELRSQSEQNACLALSLIKTQHNTK